MAEKSLSRIKFLKREADASRSKKSFKRTGKSHFSCFWANLLRNSIRLPLGPKFVFRCFHGRFLKTFANWQIAQTLFQKPFTTSIGKPQNFNFQETPFNSSASNSPDLSSRTASGNSYLAMYSNSRKQPQPPPPNLTRKNSGNFDDFNTIAKQSRKLKYRGPSEPSESRSISRSKKPRAPAKMRDFYDKLSQEFQDDRSERSISKGRSPGKGKFQSHWGRQSWWKNNRRPKCESEE